MKSAEAEIMASNEQVKQYVAYWLQLGKKVVIRNGDRTLQPEKIIAGDRYSEDFEACWQEILSPESGDCYIEGTDETIAELLTSKWDIILCCRCVMPVPLRTQGMPPDCCPCFDLSNWPNPELPQPRTPVNNKATLSSIRHRILESHTPELSDVEESPQVQDPHNRQKFELPIRLNLPRCRLNRG